MKKRFNYTGVCVPEKHYMVDISDKIRRIFKMIEAGDYFVINRPRQYGKTTVVHMLNRFLKTRADYFPINISFEGIDAPTYSAQDRFIKTFMDILKDKFLFLEDKQPAELIDRHRADTQSMAELSRLISLLVKTIGKNTVLMIDEVDKSCNNQLFLDFLGMLRDKYLKQAVGEDRTFHSVILAGVHDVKTMKIKIRSGDEAKYNSPWNIAVDFEVGLSLSADGIAAMLEEYKKEQEVEIDTSLFAGKLFYYTSGYPFLVSYLCKIIDENILPGKNKRQWDPHDLERAVQLAIMKESTNFDSLIKNIENNPDLYELVFNIIMNGMTFSYNRRNTVIHLGTLYGILREENRKTRIHNRLYEQLIYDYMSSKIETSGDTVFKGTGAGYVAEDGSLDIEKVIRKFQEFMKEQYDKKDAGFIERNGRLLFLAFIKPIINGDGFDFKEVQISEEKRLDVVITYGNKKYIVELKVWRGDAYHSEGIKQLCDYLDRQNQAVGYLLIYDPRKETGKTGKCETLKPDDKEIFAAWV